MPQFNEDLPQTRKSRRGSRNFLIVGIGASAGGLEACTKFLDALPANPGMAFILIQHLDPEHESRMVELLENHTSMTVIQAVNGIQIERDCFYIIPPGTYLAVRNGALLLSKPPAARGLRLPFDFFLHSLADQYGDRAVAIILSGTGADGSLELKNLKKKGALVIAQSPAEATHPGMPESAIATATVDLVLPVAQMPEAIGNYSKGVEFPRHLREPFSQNEIRDSFLSTIISLLRANTARDFTLYKNGTLQRRVERRMILASMEGNMDKYYDLLRTDPVELNRLAEDLLINVTGFFRDPKVFDFLSERIIPDLVRNHSLSRPLRVWVAGCSTGEEAYSIAILFCEAISDANVHIKLQVFASDVDVDAIAAARNGLYSESIKTDVSEARLNRFFSKEENQFRVTPELRAAVIFTIQDLLIDPPFSHLDMVSCRNLLIYFGPEAQAKAISLFYFGLLEDGILLLGSSETAGKSDGRFKIISKPEQIYKRIGTSQSQDSGRSFNMGDANPFLARISTLALPHRQISLADLCKQLVLDTYAPAAVLVNSKYECVYFLGKTDHYLHVAPGHPTHNLLTMVTQDVRAKLRLAIQQAGSTEKRVKILVSRTDSKSGFGIEVQSINNGDEQFFLVCFIDEPQLPQGQTVVPQSDISRVAELELEFEAARLELQSTIHDFEILSEDQRAINQEALSANEEFQSTNEELLTSKEELQSLNEELTALNSQLQETLERQRTTSNDLQNILNSTNVATLFLDTNLNIRFFTPATEAIFRLIPADIGRPLSAFNSLAPDATLLSDAAEVLNNTPLIEREIKTDDGRFFARRVLPYRSEDKGTDGVVITFSDITEQMRNAKALNIAKQEAELANIAKSRFLAAASHDLRQPLQTLVLLQESLSKAVRDEEAKKMIIRLDETLGAMSGMLNTLLDINQIDAGTVAVNVVSFPLNDLLMRLREEFTYHAHAKGLSLRVVSSSLSVRSDPSLLEQMLRNLLTNALKYTMRGKVLLGCRLRAGAVRIEVWDTGIGIPNEEHEAIFGEYYQLDNSARDKEHGLGLGLSIVKRLGNLLDHRVGVRSHLGKGSIFAIEVPQGQAEPKYAPNMVTASYETAAPSSNILIIEDIAEVRDLIEHLLKEEGYKVSSAPDGISASELISTGLVPDLILADHNLPNGMNGLQVTAEIRRKLGQAIPSIILTGDISSETLRDIAESDCVRLSKPVKFGELDRMIRTLLPLTHLGPMQSSHVETPTPSAQSTIFVVDDDKYIRDGIRAVLEGHNFIVSDYATCEEFLESYRPISRACLLIDANLPGMNGLELLQRLRQMGQQLPSIMITGNGGVPMAVSAMKAGATDFIEKPIMRGDLLTSIESALEQSQDKSKFLMRRQNAMTLVSGLTKRQREIMDMVLAGQPNKIIAGNLSLSQRTVENHRATIMRKTGSKSLPELARLAVAATANQD